MDTKKPAALGKHDVHIWKMYRSATDQDHLVEKHSCILSPEEIDHSNSFKFRTDQIEYQLTRIMLRLVLSNYSERTPEQWRFVRNKFGRPELNRNLSVTGLRFNLTKTRNLALCAVTLNREIGVDAEYIDFSIDLKEIADSILTPVEKKHWLENNMDEANAYTYWVLKEAYSKARGKGLSINFKRIGFSSIMSANPRLSAPPPCDPFPDNWQFYKYPPSSHHVAAVSVAAKEKELINWEFIEFTP